MSLKPYPRLDSPVLTTIAFAIGTLWANWIWAGWFTQAKDMEIVLLAMVSLVGYPLTLVIAACIPMYVMLRLKDHF